MTQQAPPRLSICIPTYNRAEFIGKALDSIVSQATKECEIVISDNASTDNTEEIVRSCQSRFERLSYIKQSTNVGYDMNCDRAMSSALGEYCWLFSDDDVMKPNAIGTVLKAVDEGYSVILVNGEHRDFTMSNVRVRSFFGIEADKVYSSTELDQLFKDVGRCAICSCCLVIKRSLWMLRERARYFGSWFVHTAVLFQGNIPGRTLVMAEPLMMLRLGNEQTAETQSFFVWYMSWPTLVWSFPLSDGTKRSFSMQSPWKRVAYLLALRATGMYCLDDNRRWIRPRASGVQEFLIPTLIALLSRKLARRFYAILAAVARWPKNPHETTASMFPKSLRTLNPELSSIDTLTSAS